MVPEFDKNLVLVLARDLVPVFAVVPEFGRYLVPEISKDLDPSFVHRWVHCLLASILAKL